MRGKSGGWLDDSATSYLLAPATSTRLAGNTIDWTQESGSALLGRCQVSAPPGSWSELRVEVRVTPKRPEQFGVLFVCDQGWIRRLCVNRDHHPLTGTHKHRILGSNEDAYTPDDIPTVSIPPVNAADDQEAVFRAFVTECSIVIPSGFTWTRAWEGA